VFVIFYFLDLKVCWIWIFGIWFFCWKKVCWFELC